MLVRTDIPAGVDDLTPTQGDFLARLVAAWFVDHAEMDRGRFLTLLDEVKEVSA